MLNFHYQCFDCQKNYPFPSRLMLCPECGPKTGAREPLKGVLEVVLESDPCSEKYDLSGDLKKFLPVPAQFFPKIPVGETPLWGEFISERWGKKKLYLKDDTCNPTASFKDRASFLVAAFARWQGISEIVAASTGNAGSSMAGIGAAAGLQVTLFLPKKAPQAKMVQSLQYGANLLLVDGTYDDAYDLSLQYVATRPGALSRNTAYNPLTIEGKKTSAIEIVRDLGGCAPETIFVPTGDGVILAGLYKGFRDLIQLGIINKMPTIYAVQAEGSSALYRTFVSGGEQFIEEGSTTVADSISVDVPRNGYHALKLLRRYQGKMICVSDEEILQAQKEMAQTTGLFVEPAAACAFAGFLKAHLELSAYPDDAAHVVMATGNGLKDIASALKGVNFPQKTIKSLTDI